MSIFRLSFDDERGNLDVVVRLERVRIDEGYIFMSSKLLSEILFKLFLLVFLVES